MKKNLTFLTGIVLVFAILVAGGCNRAKTVVNTEDQEETITLSELPAEILESETTVWISVHDTLIGCSKHLLMEDETHSKERKKVIDTLTTVVYPGYTVVWVKADGSSLKKVHQVRIMDASPWNKADSCLAGQEEVLSLDRSYIRFNVPSDADTGIVKYEIIFEDEDKNFWYIDPHLMIPPDR